MLADLKCITINVLGTVQYTILCVRRFFKHISTFLIMYTSIRTLEATILNYEYTDKTHSYSIICTRKSQPYNVLTTKPYKLYKFAMVFTYNLQGNTWNKQTPIVYKCLRIRSDSYRFRHSIRTSSNAKLKIEKAKNPSILLTKHENTWGFA